MPKQDVSSYGAWAAVAAARQTAGRLVPQAARRCCCSALGQLTVTAVSSTTNDVCKDESSEPLNFSVTV
jgi:hypothetical protein